MAKDETIINENTTVNLSLKTIISTVGAVLIVFFVFYELVFLPRIDRLDRSYDNIMNNQNQMLKELSDIHNSINEIKIENKFYRDLKPNKQASIQLTKRDSTLAYTGVVPTLDLNRFH